MPTVRKQTHGCWDYTGRLFFGVQHCGCAVRGVEALDAVSRVQDLGFRLLKVPVRMHESTN